MDGVGGMMAYLESSEPSLEQITDRHADDPLAFQAHLMRYFPNLED